MNYKITETAAVVGFGVILGAILIGNFVWNLVTREVLLFGLFILLAAGYAGALAAGAFGIL